MVQSDGGRCQEAPRSVQAATPLQGAKIWLAQRGQPSTMPAMWRAVICGFVLWLSACAAPAKQTATDSPPTTAGSPAASPNASPSTGPSPAGAASAPAKAAPRGVLLWSALSRTPVPSGLGAAVSPTLVEPDVGGLAHALTTLGRARQALAALRCGEALQPITQAIDRLLVEHLIVETRPILGDLYSVLLLCADRANDATVARRAAAALFALRVAVPPDVALVLARHQTAIPYGPPMPPVRVESDPPGAQVARNLLPLGPTPLWVEGGAADAAAASAGGTASPSADFIDIELPGFRKLHRPLPATGELVLALRPEDRPQVLLERASLQEPGSAAQAAILRTLADLVAATKTAATPRQIVVVWPKEQAGTAVAGEALAARVYDLDKRDWLAAQTEIAAGPLPSQGPAVVALLRGGDAATPAGVTAALAAGGAAGKGAAGKDAAAGKEAPKKKGLFGNTKWYTWVVAGGVVALIAGLLIAEKVSPEKVTISATR
jgi:hypothetical protein